MDLKRMLRGRQFWLAVLLAVAGMLLGTAYPKWKKAELLPGGAFLNMVSESLKSRIVLFLLPITAVLPFAEEYLRERQWNFLRVLIVRKGRKNYCRDKMLTEALAGALVWIFAVFIQVLFFFLLFFGREEVFRYPKELFVELLTSLGRVALTASALSSFGGVCAALGNSIYLAMGLPFVAYYLLVILRTRYLEKLYCIDPFVWLKGEYFWGSDQRGLWIFLILLAVFFLLLHGWILEKRLEEL